MGIWYPNKTLSNTPEFMLTWWILKSQVNQPCTPQLELSIPPTLTSQAGRGTGGWIDSQWPIIYQSYLGTRYGELLGWWTCEDLKKWYTWIEHGSSVATYFPTHLIPRISSLWLFLSYILLQWTGDLLRKLVSWVPEQINQTQERELEDL